MTEGWIQNWKEVRPDAKSPPLHCSTVKRKKDDLQNPWITVPTDGEVVLTTGFPGIYAALLVHWYTDK